MAFLLSSSPCYQLLQRTNKYKLQIQTAADRYRHGRTVPALKYSHFAALLSAATLYHWYFPGFGVERENLG